MKALKSIFNFNHIDPALRHQNWKLYTNIIQHWLFNLIQFKILVIQNGL